MPRRVLVLLLVGLLTACSTTADPEKVRAPKETHDAVMPDLYGMDSVEAYGLLDDLGLPVRNESFIDLSVLHRRTDGVSDWTVWSSIPAAGEEVTPGTELHVFELKIHEWRFFDQNPTMPAMPVKAGHDVRAPYPEPFLDIVSELTEWRYAPGHTPKGAKKTTSWPRSESGLPVDLDPSIEPDAERERRARYREAEDFSDEPFVRLAQKPGTPLRPGQIITILVRPDPMAHPEMYPNYTGPGSDAWESQHDTDIHVGGDDDDVNVPGWLCPTRFC